MHAIGSRLGRRQFVQGVGVGSLGLVAGCARLPGQAPPKVPRLGYLSGSAPPSDGNVHTLHGFQQGLQDLGYTEGQNIVIEYRWAEGHEERLPALAVELVQLNVDIILAGGGGQPPTLPRLRRARSPSSLGPVPIRLE